MTRRRFYLSTGKDRGPEIEWIVRRLQAEGWERTFDWGAALGQSPDNYAEVAAAELDGVRDADVLVALLPGGYGTHVEMGYALALKKPVILHAPDQETLATPYPCIFHYHADVKLFVSSPIDIDGILSFMRESVEQSSEPTM
jgi:nucleoside 2-deoxyribosyltransferase